MLENQIGKRYAEALSNSISDESKLGPALNNLKDFWGAFETEKQLPRFFAHPAIASENKRQVVTELCDKLGVEQGVRNMLSMLTQRNKILFLKNIAGYFEGAVDRRLNQVRVDVRSAHPLTEGDKQRLKSDLSRILEKTVLLETQVDESLIGGVQVRVGDQVADATIKNRLAILKRKIETEEDL